MDDDERVAEIRARAEAVESRWRSQKLYENLFLDTRESQKDIPWLLDRPRATEAERDETHERGRDAAETRAAEAEAVIAGAPHEDPCAIGFIPAATGIPLECTCWKSHYRAGAEK